MRCAITLLFCLASMIASAAPDEDSGKILTLATTTSTQNSGLLDYIHPDFEAKTGIRIRVVAKGTGASLQLAREGNADVVLAHAPAEEIKFVEEGYGIDRTPVMSNDFVLIGPKADPACIASAKDAAEAIKRIHDAQSLFVSRGDRSGTHEKEQELWQASGVPLETKNQEVVVNGERMAFSMVAPSGDWYKSIGQGMGSAIQYATEKQGYTLSDRGTYYAYALDATPRTDLVILYEGGAALDNPYTVIAVNPKKFPDIHYESARKYIDWIASPETQAKIAGFTVGGKVLFHPAIEPPAAP